MENEAPLFDSEKFMQQYSRLSQNKLETEVARAYGAQVKKDVQDAQDRADNIVNALTSRSKPPNFNIARTALAMLARGPSVVVAHWQPFIAAVAEVLPARDEGEKEDARVVDSAAEGEAVKDLRATFGSIGAVLPLASARELRDLREGFSMLSSALGAEFGKRGMEFQRDASAAVLSRLGEELDVAAAPEPLPKDFAFSDARVLAMRQVLEAQREQLIETEAKLKELQGIVDTSDPALQPRLADLEAQVASLTAERDAAYKTRDEMAAAADKHEAEKKEAVDAVQSAKEKVRDLEHEVDQLKKKSQKQR